MEEAVAARPRRGLQGKLASCHGKVGGRGERYAAVLRDALNIIYIMRNDVSDCGGVRVLGVRVLGVAID